MFEAPIAASSLADQIDAAAKDLEARVIAWRRDIHANPELGNREFRTAGIVAEHLRALGLDEVRTGVAAHRRRRRAARAAARAGGRAARRHGRAAGDRGGRPAVRVEGAGRTWNGEEVGVMHACGHDAHVAILMGVAEVLAGLRDAAARLGQVHLPAGRGAAARGRGRRREADDRGGRAREPGAGGDLRPARHLAAARSA